MKRLLGIIILGLFPLQLNAISNEIYTAQCIRDSLKIKGKLQEYDHRMRGKEEVKIKYDVKNNILLEMDNAIVNAPLEIYFVNEREKTYAAKTNIELGSQIGVIKIVTVMNIAFSFEYTIYDYPYNTKVAQTINTMSVKQFEDWLPNRSGGLILRNNKSKYGFEEKEQMYLSCR